MNQTIVCHVHSTRKTTANSKYQHRPFYELWSPDSTEYHGHQMMDLQWQHGGQDTLKPDGFDSFKNETRFCVIDGDGMV